MGENDDDFQIPLAHYRLCTQYVCHSDTIKWTVFSIFALLNGFLISAIVENIGEIDYGKIVISVFGLGSSVTWLIVAGRTQAYLIDRMKKAMKVEKDYLKKFNEYLIFGKRVKNKKGKHIWKKDSPEGEYWFQNISAEGTSYVFISIIIFWWLSYLTYCFLDISGLVEKVNEWTITLIVIYIIVGLMVGYYLNRRD